MSGASAREEPNKDLKSSLSWHSRNRYHISRKRRAWAKKVRPTHSRTLRQSAAWAEEWVEPIIPLRYYYNTSLAAIWQMCQSCKGVKEWKRVSCRFVHTLLPPLLALLGMVQACLVLGTQLPSPSIPPTLLSAGYLSPSDLTCIRRPWTIELCYCCCGGLRHLCNWSSTELQVSEFTLTFFLFFRTEK